MSLRYAKTQKPYNILTLMTHITLDQFSTYLSAGATLDDIRSMMEMLRNHEEEILSNIAEWYDLIPDASWGDRARHKDFKTIVSWLYRMGYVLRLPTLGTNKDDAMWQLVRNEQIGRLHWECDRFFIEGLPKPEESDNDANRVPECLSCWE